MTALGPTAALLRESFEALRAEVPPCWRRVAEGLGGLRVRIEVDGEAWEVEGRSGGPAVAAPAPAPQAVVRTSSAAILEVLDGRLGLEAAVLDGALEVLAPLDVVQRLHRALLDYVHGGVRAPSFPGFLLRYRALLDQRR